LPFGLAALIRAGGLARCEAEGHAQYRLTRVLAGDGNPKSCGLITSKQTRLLETEQLSFAELLRALHDRDRCGECVTHAVKSELLLGAEFQ
jgi:hypothetical protein